MAPQKTEESPAPPPRRPRPRPRAQTDLLFSLTLPFLFLCGRKRSPRGLSDPLPPSLCLKEKIKDGKSEISTINFQSTLPPPSFLVTPRPCPLAGSPSVSFRCRSLSLPLPPEHTSGLNVIWRKAKEGLKKTRQRDID